MRQNMTRERNVEEKYLKYMKTFENRNLDEFKQNVRTL